MKMTDKEILDVASRCIKWVDPKHALMYDDELVMFARAVLAAAQTPAEPICEMYGVWFSDPDSGKSGWVSRELVGGIRMPELYWPKERTDMVRIDERYQPRLIRLEVAEVAAN